MTWDKYIAEIKSELIWLRRHGQAYGLTMTQETRMEALQEELTELEGETK